jgi:hypothetical protein
VVETGISIATEMLHTDDHLPRIEDEVAIEIEMPKGTALLATTVAVGVEVEVEVEVAVVPAAGVLGAGIETRAMKGRLIMEAHRVRKS